MDSVANVFPYFNFFQLEKENIISGYVEKL